MKQIKLTILSGLTLMLAACGSAPLGQSFSARSLGRGNIRLDTQLQVYNEPARSQTTVFPNLQLGYGLSENTDFYVRTEMQTATLIPKYSFIQSNDGFSWAGLLGLSFIGGRSSYFAGTTVSYLSRGFEPYLGLRYNVANIDSSQFDASYFSGAAPDVRFTFVSVIPGLTYWITPTTGVGTEVTILNSSSSVRFVAPEMYSLHLSLLF